MCVGVDLPLFVSVWTLDVNLPLIVSLQSGELPEQQQRPPQLTDLSIRLVRPDVLLSDRLLPPLLAALSEPRPPPTTLPGTASDRWRWVAPRLPAAAALSFSDLALSSLHGDRRLSTRLGGCRLEASCAPRLAEAAASLKLEELSVEAADATRLASLANLQVGEG